MSEQSNRRLSHGEAAYTQLKLEIHRGDTWLIHHGAERDVGFDFFSLNIGAMRDWEDLSDRAKAIMENVAAAAINNYNQAPEVPDL
jgi:hypothetical protein